MLVVGKPGSGKTSTIKEMLTSSEFYLHKFDQVLILSPSASKMGIPINKRNMNQQFDLRWIEEKLMEINKSQVQRIATRLKELKIIDRFDVDKLNGKLTDQIKAAQSEQRGQPFIITGKQQQQIPNTYGEKDRFFTPQIKQSIIKDVKAKGKQSQPKTNEQTSYTLAQYVDAAYQEFYVKLPPEEKPYFQKNCLIVFDDMVSQLKANEFNPLMSQLVFNRRHLLLGGTISIMIVSQKYTMIPARLRSNANWFILFRLNPIDFESVYKDVVMMQRDKWEDLLDFAFGGIEKKYNNLGIWIESDDYFLNFKKINFTSIK